ncbi:MAG TPA: dihydrodipicolinate synthase family protein, partial [Actinomycetota bacterium]|nr:dihydrodipicolinate synthase family protein [Actinomycetota bacterium]
MSSPPVFTGVGVALVTLFDTGGNVDAPATAAHAARLVELGVRAVVVAGSTGEASAISLEERAGLLHQIRPIVPAGISLIAGTGAPSARQAVSLTRSACDEGVDAVLTLSPPGVSDPGPYYRSVAEAAGEVPVLAYHWPAMAAPGIQVEALAGLPIAGCKDSSGDADRLLHALTTWGGPLYTGSSALLAYAGPLGCAGAILALANADPEGCIAP